MSVASQSLMDNITYEDLYRRWEQGNWSAYDIDFSGDRAGWEGLSDIQRRSAMWIYSMFFYGEDRVADTLAPYITAAPTEEQSYFLATQQVDEVRHSVFFHRFFKEVIGVGGETLQQTLASTLPQLNWGYRGIFDRLDVMAEELRKDRSLPKYAQAITLYHLIVEGSLAQPGQHFIEDFFASEETMPGFSSGMANVSKDEQRHIGFGVKVLSELLAEGVPGYEENRAAVVELLKETLPYGPAVFYPPNLDTDPEHAREYTECYGFSLEDIFAFGLKLIRQRWRTIGFPTEEMPPGVFPFDPDLNEEQIAENQVKLMMGGILGPPNGRTPDASPELQRLYFDVITRVANPAAANGSPLVYQWRFSDADPWHLVIDNGSTRAEPGEAPSPTVTIETSWADWVASGKPDANQLKMLLQRRIRPRGPIREIARLRRVFN
jgi:Ribonucleotide reductase, small chain/SCP-2 sterol transfer family